MRARAQDTYWNSWWRRRQSRRRILQGGAVGAAGLSTLALVGCGDDDDDDDDNGNGGQTATATSAPSGDATATPTTAASGPKAGGTQVGNATNVFETMDPHRTVASPVLVILSRSHSKILRFSNPNTGELTGDLAEDWETPDAQTVVLKIRPGVKWHAHGPGARNPAAAAGRDLTLDDIVYNIERQQAGLLADGSEGSFGRKSYWNKVDAIEAGGETITLRLKSPDATFVQGLANEFNLIVQKELIEAVEGTASEVSADKVIGTGPYIVTEFVPGQGMSQVRNPDYYLKDRPYLDSIRWLQMSEDPTAYRIAFEQKQVDSFSDPDPGTTIAIHEANKDATRLRYSGVANTVAIYLPHLQPPWNDIRLVQAIHLAADRRQLIQQIHDGLGKVSGPVPWLQQAWAIPEQELDTTPGYRVQKEQDLTEARALWEAAEGDKIGDVSWVIPEVWAARAGWGSTPEIVAEMFNRAFDTSQFKGKVASYSEIIPSWFSKDFEPFFGWIPNVEVPDARTDLLGAYLSSSPGNIWGVNEPERVDAKLQEAVATVDDEEAYALVREVQDLALENGLWGRTIMYNYISATANWNYLHPTGPSEEEGWSLLGYSLDGHDLWIDPDDPSFAGRATPQVTPL